MVIRFFLFTLLFHCELTSPTLLQSSGVSVNDAVIQAYNELKTGRKFKYVFFKINDELTEIVVEKEGPANATYDQFLDELKSVPKDDCRYCVFDFEWETAESGKRNKICFYAWCPETAKLKKKMIYASSKDSLRKKLVGIGAEIQGTDFAEVSYESVFERVSKGAGNN